MSDAMEWLQGPVARVDVSIAEAAAARQAPLIKPPGALGRLETAGVHLAGLQGRLDPALDRVRIVLFVADEAGVAAKSA